MTLIEMIEHELDEKLDPVVVDILLTLDSEIDLDVKQNFWVEQQADPKKKRLLVIQLYKSKIARDFIRKLYF